MRPTFVPLDVPLDDTPGAASEGVPCAYPELCIYHTVQVSGTFTTTDLRLEVSNDGATWAEIDAFTAPEIAEYSALAFKLLRVRTATFGALDTPVVVYAGMNVRVEAW